MNGAITRTRPRQLADEVMALTRGLDDESRRLVDDRLRAMADLAEAADAATWRLRLAIGTYLDHPGCNAPARATAMAKLRWAMERRP